MPVRQQESDLAGKVVAVEVPGSSWPSFRTGFNVIDGPQDRKEGGNELEES